MKFVFLGVQLAALVKFRSALIRELVSAGHEVVAIAPEATAYWLDQLAATGARYKAPPMARNGLNPLWDMYLLVWLIQTLWSEKPDVLFCFQAKAVIYGLPAGFVARVRRRVAMIEGLGQGFIKGQGLKRRIVRFIVPVLYFISLCFGHKVIFLNADDEADFLRLRLARARQTARIPGIGVDLSRFAFTPLPPGPLVFLMIGRLIADKGVREYLAAAQQVKERYPETVVQLIGEADTTHAGVPLSEITATRAVEYLGEVPDVAPYLRSCHVFVLPSYREGMPMACMEALATGRAVIVTDAPGTREMIKNHENGELVPVRDSHALAAAMIKLIDSRQTLAQKGTLSRQLAEARFDSRVITQQVIDILMGRTA